MSANLDGVQHEESSLDVALVYSPRLTEDGLIDVDASLDELAPLVDANWCTVWWIRAMPWRRRRLVRMHLDWSRETWTAMNAAGGPSQD